MQTSVDPLDYDDESNFIDDAKYRSQKIKLLPPQRRSVEKISPSNLSRKELDAVLQQLQRENERESNSLWLRANSYFRKRPVAYTLVRERAASRSYFTALFGKLVMLQWALIAKIYLNSSKTIFNTHPKGILHATLSIAWCAMYVWQTYLPEHPPWMIALDFTMALVFLCLFLLNLYITENRVRYALSFYAFIDYFTILPALIEAISFDTFFRVVSILRIFRTLSIMNLINSMLWRQVFRLTFTVLSLIFVSTCIILIVEPETVNNEFHVALYFVVVSITTLGYGDMAPKSAWGRFFVVIMVLSSVVLVPLQAVYFGKLLQKMMGRYDGSFIRLKGMKHIIVTGHITQGNLVAFANEFYSKRNRNLYKMVVLLKDYPGRELEFLARTKFYQRIYFYKGTPLQPKDLMRIRVDKAKACFIVIDPELTENLESKDMDNALYCLCFRNVRKRLPIFVQMRFPETSTLLRSVGKYLYSFSYLELRMGMLAKATMVKGSLTFVTNLVRTVKVRTEYYDQDTDLYEYYDGSNNQIFMARLPEVLAGSRFNDIVKLIYKNYKSILFAVQMPDNTISLNPGNDYIMEGGEIAFFITRDPAALNLTKSEIKLSSLMTQAPNPGSVKPSVDEGRRNSIEISSLSREYWTNIFRSRDPDILKGQYTCYDEPPTYSEGQTMPKDIANHIIISGDMTDWFYFIAPLREAHISDLKPIVILSTTMTPEKWNKIAIFPEVWIQQGSAIQMQDLIRVNIDLASVCILVGTKHDPDSSSPDRNTILAYVNIRNYFPKCHVILELFQLESLGFSNSTHFKDPYLYPEFMRGSVFHSHFIQILMAQAVVNPLLLDIVRQFVQWKDTNDDSARQQTFKDNLILISLPDGMQRRTFEDLFKSLLQQNILALGLYRRTLDGARATSRGFVVTNPDPSLPLRVSDKVYVLASNANPVLRVSHSLNDSRDDLMFTDSDSNASSPELSRTI